MRESRWAGALPGALLGVVLGALLGVLLALPAGAAEPVVSRPGPDIGKLALPVAAPCISSPFGPRPLPGPHAAAFHFGIDLPAPAGAWVRAAAPGRVAQIRRLGSDGLEVDLVHTDAEGRRYMTRYAHLGTVAPALAEGRRSVAAGQAIGRVGRSGITYGTHLHFEVRVGGTPIDPAPFFSLTRCSVRSARR